MKNRQEQQLARACRILHDRVGGTLTGVGVQLELMLMDFGPRAPQIEQPIRRIQMLLEKVIDDVRGLSRQLRPRRGFARRRMKSTIVKTRRKG